MVILVLEKSRSGSADMVGIDRKSNAILLRLRYAIYCVSCIHQLIVPLVLTISDT
jgi:hypothetical protein